MPALVRKDAEVSQLPVNLQSSLQLFTRADAGDQPAIEALKWYCAGLARFIHNLQVILDLEVVAIGGGVSAQPRLLHTLKDQVDRTFDTAALRVPPPRIEACTHRNDANLLGAPVHHLRPVA